MPALLPIVEGPGDLSAVPAFLRRILEHHNRYDVTILRPHVRGDFHRVRRDFANYVRVAIKEQVPILWIMDCDDDCPINRVAELRLALGGMYCPVPIRFALLVREFESMFLHDPEGCRSILPIPAGVIFPAEPESIRGAKEWLTRCLPSGQAYKPSVHQTKLVAAANLEHLRARSRSFRHLESALLSIV
jgi:hypothetical protein